MVKKTKLFALLKFGSLLGSTSASFTIVGIFAICKKIGEFLKQGLALILRYFLTIYCLALVRPEPNLNGHTLRFYYDRHKRKNHNLQIKLKNFSKADQ